MVSKQSKMILIEKIKPATTNESKNRGKSMNDLNIKRVALIWNAHILYMDGMNKSGLEADHSESQNSKNDVWAWDKIELNNVRCGCVATAIRLYFE